MIISFKIYVISIVHYNSRPLIKLKTFYWNRIKRRKFYGYMFKDKYVCNVNFSITLMADILLNLELYETA